jgi:hypothetical protein
MLYYEENNMSLATELIGLAGEYAVASELCRHGVYCQLTLGNRKRTDLLVDTEVQLFRVSVKAKTKQYWPQVKGIWRADELIVFVDYKNKEVATPPDFYVLDVRAWKKVVTRIKKRIDDPRAKINNENTLLWPASKGKKDGWIGCQVSVSDVAEFKDTWPDLKRK